GQAQEHEARAGATGGFAPANIPALPPAPAPARAAGDVRIPFRGVRQKIAENLIRSKHTAAHYTYVEEVDFTDLVVLRERANERLAAHPAGDAQAVKLSFLPFVIKAV